jgi:hypothetical protein
MAVDMQPGREDDQNGSGGGARHSPTQTPTCDAGCDARGTARVRENPLFPLIIEGDSTEPLDPPPPPLASRIPNRNPSASPQRRHRAGPAGSHGAQRRRSGDTWINLNGGGAPTVLPRGPFHNVQCTIRKPASLPEAAPLSAHGRALLGQFLKMRTFWEAAYLDGFPVPFAGLHALGVKARRSEVLYDELVKAGGPYRWFRRKAMEAIEQGRVGRGRATCGDPVSEQFFTALAGGRERRDRLRTRELGHPGVFDPDTMQLNCDDAAEVEVLDFIVFRQFHARPKPKGAGRR